VSFVVKSGFTGGKLASTGAEVFSCMLRRRNLFLRESTAVAVENIPTNCARLSVLLGIVLSVSTLIVVIALISGINTYIAQRIANMGSNVFLVNQYGPPGASSWG
jgi:hypothetical protein